MKISLIVITSCLCVLLLAAVAFKLAGPRVLQSKLVTLVRESCATCDIEIGTTELSLVHPGTVVFRNVKFGAGQKGHSHGDATVESVTVDVDLGQSNLKKLSIAGVEVAHASVIYAEGDAPKIEREPRAKREQGSASEEKSDPFTFVIEAAKISDARFTYARTRKSATARMNFHGLVGTFKNLGNTQESFKKLAEAHLSGRIEKSGDAELDVAALLVPGPHYIDVSMRVRDQNLQDLNSFFETENGFNLSGLLKKGVAVVNVRDRKSKSRVQAAYKEVEFKQKVNRETGAIAAALTNVAASLFANKTNEDFPAEKQSKEMASERERDESVIHFILRSMKVALLEVATAKK